MDTTNIKNFGNSIAHPNDKETFRRYINEIMKYKPLSRDEEHELFIRIKNGDEKAIDKLCKHNLLFVVSIAKRYSSMIGKSNLTLEDLISEGNMGVCIAAKKFDNSTGNKFISYAVWWIKQCILGCIGNNIKNIRLPNNITSAIKKIKEVERKLEQKNCRDVTTLELFEAIMEEGGIQSVDSEHKIDEWYKMSGFESSLDVPIDDEMQITLSDRVKSEDMEPYEQLVNKERYQLLENMMTRVPTATKEYLKDYFGLEGRDPISLKAIGDKYNEIPATIKQRIDRALRKMRCNNRSSREFFFPTPNYRVNREYNQR